MSKVFASPVPARQGMGDVWEPADQGAADGFHHRRRTMKGYVRDTCLCLTRHKHVSRTYLR